LLRHGATANNVARPPRLQGRRSDPPLSDAGLDQARRTAALFAERRVDAVFSSPLLRAHQTAELIAAAHGLEVQVRDELTEIDVGQWEGLDWDEVARRNPEPFRLFQLDPTIHPYLGGENLQDMQARAVPAIERLLAENRGRAVVAVAHNMLNRCYFAHLLRMPLAHYRAVTQDNCGVNWLRARDGDVRALTVNSVWHLE
jgi:broad specificity phosphatase PhoE